LNTGTSGADRPAGEPSAALPQLPHLPNPTTTQKALIVAVVLSYAVGYPIALIVDSSFGWVLVTLGGFFLVALGIVTVRRIHRASPS
jgi:hypothetical protein